MYFTSGSDRAFEQLMQTRPGADHFDSGEAGAPEDCGTCRFYRPHWKYQFCVYEECPYQPGKLTALDGAVKFQVKGVDDEMAVFRVEKNRGYTVMSNHHLQTLIEADLKSTGEVSQGTKEAVQAQGFSIAGDFISRKQEFGILQSIGLTEKQLLKMLQYEGLIYSASATIITVILGAGMGYLAVCAMKTTNAYFFFNFPWAVVIGYLVAILIVQVILSAFTTRTLKKQSLVDRIKAME